MKKDSLNLKSAFREIVIVTIGILIAFAINTFAANWNQNKVHKEYKASLIADIKENLKSIDLIMHAQEIKVKDLNHVVSTLENGNYNSDSIGTILFKQKSSPTFFPINGTFKSLVSQGGIELFSTDLTRELFNLYDTNYERTVYNGNLYDNLHLNVYENEIRTVIDYRTKKIDNISRLMNKDFHENLLIIIDEAEAYLYLIGKSRSESEILLDMLNKQ